VAVTEGSGYSVHTRCRRGIAGPAGSVVYRLIFDVHRIAACPVIGWMAFKSEP